MNTAPRIVSIHPPESKARQQRSTIGEPDLERPLHGFEEFYLVNDGGMPLNFCHYATIRGNFSLDDVESALSQLRRRHSNLRRYIQMSPGRAPWFRSGALPIPVEEGRGDASELLAHLETQAVTPFRHGGPALVRCTVFRHGPNVSTVALCFHHSVADGRSGLIVLHDLLRALGESEPLEELPPLPLHAHQLPAVLTQSGGPRTEYLQVTDLLRDATRGGAASWFPTEGRAKPQHRKVAAAVRQESPEFNSALRRRARAEGTTVLGALHATQLLAAARCLSNGSAVTLNYRTTLDVRADLDPAYAEGCMSVASVLMAQERVSPDDRVWDLARKVEGRVRARMLTGVHRYLFRRLDMIARLGRAINRARPSLQSELIGKLFSPSLCLASLGRTPVQTRYGKLQVENVGGVVNPGVTTPLASGALMHADGSLIVCFNATLPLMSRSTLEEFADACMDTLRAAPNAS